MTDIYELRWGNAVDMEDYEEAERVLEEARLHRADAELGQRGVELSEYDDEEPSTDES